jgi:excisionase family DNA binding protein
MLVYSTMSSRFLTVAEAAHYLRLNPRSIYLLAQRGAIPASRVTGKWLFPVHLLDDWIETSARGRGRVVRGAPPASDLAPPGRRSLPSVEQVDLAHGQVIGRAPGGIEGLELGR